MPVGVRGLALTPEGRWLVTSSKAGGANGRLVVWDARTGARHRTIRGIGGGSLTVTADGRRVAAGDGSYADLSTGRVGRMPLDPAARPATAGRRIRGPAATSRSSRSAVTAATWPSVTGRGGSPCWTAR